MNLRTNVILQRIIPLLVYAVLIQYETQFNIWKCSHNNSLLAKKRRKKVRIPWATINERISDRHFRRMFRMTRDCFALLCSTIISKIGEKQFKSEAYIDAFLKGKDPMYEANTQTTGGYISGEVKLAITLRLLAGGDALDLGVMFDVQTDHCTKIMYDVLLSWIIRPDIGDLNMMKYLGNKRAMSRVSAGFSKRSNGVLIEAIGAIDGWLVRIVRPGWRDLILNPVSFFSRKGFYALNVQCIVDDRKKVLWVSYSHKGGSHDSSCLRETVLYEKLIEMRDTLYSLGYFILGDSAYAIESFLLPPYDGANSRSSEDDFNFYHSSARITVECAFGEIDLRWGIFWKRLTGSLEHGSLIIEGAMRLHNYLVDYRDAQTNNVEVESDIESVIFENDCLDRGIQPIVVGNDGGRPSGRPSATDKFYKMQGLKLRDKLRLSLKDHDMHRSRKEEWSTNVNTHVVRN